MADLGTDWAGVTDITYDLAEVSGRRCLAEALATRLFQPIGGVFYDAENGEDTRALLSTEVTPRGTRQRIAAQMLADERVEAAAVTVELNEKTRELVIVIDITDATGTFRLVVKPADASFELFEDQ